MKPIRVMSLVIGLLIGATGNAAVVSLNADIRAGDFVKTSGSPAGLSPPLLQLDFDILFDNAFDIPNSREGLTTNSTSWSNLTDYRYEKTLDALILWSVDADYFSFGIFGISTTQPSVGLVERYTRDAIWLSRRVDARFEAVPVPATVPEPGTLALAGLGVAGAVLFRRKIRHGV